MENEVILKRVLFGGFDRRQVMEYIADLHSKSSADSLELKETEKLRARITELEAEIIEKDNMIDRLKAEISEAENNANVGKTSAALVKESVAYADSYVESAKALARDISSKAYSNVEDAKGRVEGVMTSLNEISDTVLSLYKLMEALKNEYEGFNDIVEPEIEQSDDVVPEAEPEKEEPVQGDELPSEEDMMDFLTRMKDKYRGMLKN